jgi:molybdate transport system ATP-binding protein
MADTMASGLCIDVRHLIGDFELAASMTLPADGVTGLFGPSGSGKTRLLRIIAGLDRPQHGHVALGERTLADTMRGTHVPPHRRRLGVVFQENRLFPHYSVRGNLRYGLRADTSYYERIINQLALGPLLERYPATLSGGESRRVALGRALLTRPSMLLLDEPLTGLDAAHRRTLLGIIRDLPQSLRVPIIHISHDASELADVADHLALLHRGRLMAAGPLADLLARVELTPYLGGFHAVSVLTGTIAGHDLEYGLSDIQLRDGQLVTVPRVDGPVGAIHRVSVPIRDVALAITDPPGTSYRNRLEATINDAQPSPDNPAIMELQLGLAGQILRTRLTRRSYSELNLAVGSRVVALVRSVAFDGL